MANATDEAASAERRLVEAAKSCATRMGGDTLTDTVKVLYRSRRHEGADHKMAMNEAVRLVRNHLVENGAAVDRVDRHLNDVVAELEELRDCGKLWRQGVGYAYAA